MRTGRIAAGLALAAGVLGGCADGDTAAGDTAAGCTPPAQESELLDSYAADPVFDVRPPEVRSVREPVRSVACRVDPDWPNDPSQAAVGQTMQTAVEYDAATLSRMYDQVATGRGWRAAPVAGPVGLRYCRQVRGVTSYLSISSATPRPEVGVRAPSGSTRSVSPRAVTLFHYLTVRIAAAPEQPACPGG